MERFRGSGKNGKRTCRYCPERAKWRVRNKQGWGWVYACHNHKERLLEIPQPAPSIRDNYYTEADFQLGLDPTSKRL